MDGSNRVIVEAWRTILFEKFCRFKHLLVEGLSQHSDAALGPCARGNGVWAPSSTWFITAKNPG
jgi:hypothetical protein